ncbi:MFS general substrate transporter [Wolfiporia cocos MD-104 SS10]|uniref:MFS general substrate transporter n=1 Tax=Wolfiporia cocos (strain MD-104) TaxID=742152 RepID=A0A2H3JEZ3_WOLCO|nr:MFS general substrate transporter [Wolfiporia cocos MD-104 SS10]
MGSNGSSSRPETMSEQLSASYCSTLNDTPVTEVTRAVETAAMGRKLDAKTTTYCDAGRTRYIGSGTSEDPYVVDWDEADPENPFNWSKSRKWVLTMQLASATWVASFCSSAYSGGLDYTARDLHITREVALLGISLYVLGFVLGPLFWAPLSEMYGRRIVFICTFIAFTLLHLGGSLCHNAATLLSTRMLAGMFGVSPFTNSGAALADIWVPRERGVASSLYACAPFLGPVVGPIVGGWVSMSRLGWRFVFWIILIVIISQYAPVLLRRRAQKLRKASEGKIVYISKFDVGTSTSKVEKFRRNMERPFMFLVTEPIVLFLAIYVSIAYAILYGFFAAFPIVFQEQRHWSPGMGGLAFIGVGVGTTFGMSLAPLQNKFYWAAMARSPTGRAPPEARLYSPMFGGLCLPVGMFWFAWTSNPHVFWLAPILAGAPFGTGVALVMQGLTQYLMDAYQIYGASALAATVVLRSICAAVFPIIVPVMYQRLGDGWASSVFGFLVAACMPLPFLLYKYGPWIRKHSKWAIQDTPTPLKRISADVAENSVEGVSQNLADGDDELDEKSA